MKKRTKRPDEALYDSCPEGVKELAKQARRERRDKERKAWKEAYERHGGK